jgi:hypothetical protein
MKASLFARLRRADVALWAAVLGVLPLPLWFLMRVALAPPAAWRGEYRPREASGTGAPAVVFERELTRYWDRDDRVVPGGSDVKAFSARWQACMRLNAARAVPVMLVASGRASFALDGTELLRLPLDKTRRSAGAVLRFEPGVHLLTVDLDAAGWPSIALQASFEGEPPAPLGSGRVAPGVSIAPPRPGASPCGEP